MEETHFEENSTIDDKCIALFKIAKQQGFPIPRPNIHIYLSWILDIPNNPKLQETMSKYVVMSLNKLEDIIKKDEHSLYPNAIPYLTGKTSGDFLTSYNSFLGREADIDFPSTCYSIAGYHGKKMGKTEESNILGLLALGLKDYTRLLSMYHQQVNGNLEFQITDSDRLEFKKYLEPKRKNIGIITPRKIAKKINTFKLI